MGTDWGTDTAGHATADDTPDDTPADTAGDTAGDTAEDTAGESDGWRPRSRVGAVAVALLTGDQDAAEQVADEPQDHDKEPEVLAAAIRLAVRSFFDEDTPTDAIADFVAVMARDVEVDQETAVTVIRAHVGPDDQRGKLLAAFPPQEVIDTTWSVFGYLCEQRLGREDSLELIAEAERQTLGPA